MSLSQQVFSAAFAFSVLATAVPQPVITTSLSNNGYGTIGGRLDGSNSGKVIGISVRNGNISYATTTDLDGRWALVIRHLTTTLYVQSWDPANPNDRSSWASYRLDK